MPEEHHSGQTDGVIYLDRPRRLRWNLRALKRLAQMQEDGGVMEFIGEALQLGLQWEDPDITVEQIEEMVNTDNLPDVVEAINGVILRMNRGGNGASPLPGLTSGPSEDTTLASPVENSGS